MSALRRVPPVHSPVPAAALAGGLRALVAGEGDLRRRMERRLVRRFGARRVVFTDSGTSALTLALAGAAEVGGGGLRVALPAFGCYDLVTAVRGAGVEPVLYDVHPRTLSPDPDSLREVAESGVAAVVAAHLHGVPVDLDEVAGAAADAGALVVEDAAQGVGASYRGRPLGSFGSVSVLSFGRGKGLSGGGGGALLAHDGSGEAVLEAAGDVEPAEGRGARELLVAAAQGLLGRPATYALPAALPFLALGETVYRPPRPPRDIASACLGVLAGSWLPSLRAAESRRRRARRLLRRARASADVAVVEPPAEGRPGYLRFPVVARDGSARQRLAAPDARRLGVTPGYPRPLHGLDAFRAAHRDGRDAAADLPGADVLARRLFTFPVHGRTSPADLSRLERLLAAPGG